MYVWKFDENRCDFVPVGVAAREADPEGTYLVSDGDLLYLQEGDCTRRIARDETLIHVAGQAFERDAFEFQALNLAMDQCATWRRLTNVETTDLQADMRRDGAAMRQWLRAHEELARWVIEQVLPAASGPWEKIEGFWGDGTRSLAVSLGLSRHVLLPVLQLDLGRHGGNRETHVWGTLTAQWSGDRVLDVEPILHGKRVEPGAWWQDVAHWFELPPVSIDATLMDEP